MAKIMLTRPEVERRVYAQAKTKNSREKEMGPLPLYKRGEEGAPFPRPRKVLKLDDGDVGETSAELEQRVRNLSTKEKQALLDRLAFDLAETEATRDVQMWAVAVQMAVDATLGAEGASAYGSMLYQKLLGAKTVFRPIEAFVEQAFPDDFNVAQRQAAFNYLAGLVVREADDVARYTRQPLGPKLIAQRQAHVRGIFDKAFPGYLESRLAKVIFRRHADRRWDGDREIAA